MTRKFRTIKGRRTPLRGGMPTMRSEDRNGSVIHGSIFETKKQGEHPDIFIKSDKEWGHLFDSHEDKHSIGLEPKGKSLQGKRKYKKNESGFGF
jgi:hypothetical protein